MLNYFSQMIACSGVLYAYYHFFLRNGKFHQYNRLYLLLAMVLSITLPLIKIPVTLAPQKPSSIIYAFAGQGENVIVTTTGRSMYTDVLPIIYLSVACVLLLRFLISILWVFRLRKSSTNAGFSDSIVLLDTTHPDAPFSFFNWLFWHTGTSRQSSEGRQMLQHELFHIRSKHSLDLVFMEVVLGIFWLNPFFYLYRKEIRDLHEFLADQYATRDSDALAYAELLLLKAIRVKPAAVIHPFFHHPIKRRIIMLTSTKNSPGRASSTGHSPLITGNCRISDH